MAAITRLDRGQFRINFESLKRSLLPLSRRLLFTGDMLQVDPQLILEAIRRVMVFCELHDGLGRPLVWNEYKVFLSREDHEEFVHMEPVLFAQADELLDGYRATLAAEVIGDLTLRLVVDDGKALPRGVGVLQVATKVNRDLDEIQAQLGEITIRLPSRASRKDAPTPAAEAPSRPARFLPSLPPAETPTGTQRVVEHAENLTLTWSGGSAAIRPGVRWIVGRATDPPVAEHSIQLPDASTRVSSRAFWVEAKAEGATIGRFDHDTANAVQVKGELLMRGGEIWVYEFPAAIQLTSGEYELSLERN